MSSSFALKSYPALPNPAQTSQSEVLPEWPVTAKRKLQPHTGDGLISSFFCSEDSFFCICKIDPNYKLNIKYRIGKNQCLLRSHTSHALLLVQLKHRWKMTEIISFELQQRVKADKRISPSKFQTRSCWTFNVPPWNGIFIFFKKK